MFCEISRNSPPTKIAGLFFSPPGFFSLRRREISLFNNQSVPVRVSASATMAAARGEIEGVGHENVADPEPATQNRADDGAGPSEPMQVDVESLRRRVLDLGNRETEAKETVARLEAAAKELGHELEALKRAADDAKGVHDRAKAEIGEKKALGLFVGPRDGRLRVKLNGDLDVAKSNLEAATAAATAKRNERTEANKKVDAQKEVVKDLKAEWKEAKTVLDSFTVKGAEVTEMCPRCMHGNVTKAGKTNAGAQRFTCRCALLNCASCPVCMSRRNPNLPLTKAVMDACRCNICRCHCLCVCWTATAASRMRASTLNFFNPPDTKLRRLKVEGVISARGTNKNFNG